MNQKKRKLGMILMVMIFLYILFSKHVIGKYVGHQKTAGEVQVASPVLVVEGEQCITIDKNHPEKEYDFLVKNYTEEKINDVIFEYTIYLQTNIKDKINLQLNKEEEEIKLANGQTEKIRMDSGEKIEHGYHLKIETKEEADEVIGNITIKVLAEQKQ